MQTIRVTGRIPEAEIAAWAGRHPDPSHYDILLTGSTRVYGPRGEPVAVLVKGGMDAALVDDAYEALHWLRKMPTDNRPLFASQGRLVQERKKDGTLSRTKRSKQVPSAIIGYADRYVRIPFCRQTAFTSKHPDRWATILPLLQQVAQVFKRQLPTRYAIQLEAASRTTPDFVIPDTPFTTITVNNTLAAAYHQDAGDYKPGFGVLGVIRRGEYRGCELVLPEVRVAVDMGHCDLLFFDPHIWHGNVPIFDAVGEPMEDYERISMVFYHREKMLDCGTLADELERAKSLGR